MESIQGQRSNVIFLKVWFEKLHATTKFLFEAADKYELKLPLWSVSRENYPTYSRIHFDLKIWGPNDLLSSLWKPN